MNTKTLCESVAATLTRQMGGKATVTLTDANLRFSVDCGERTEAVGGWCGGTTYGYVPKGRMFPTMLSGRNPFGGTWYDILEPLGWFETQQPS